jgi:acyl dehydratase
MQVPMILKAALPSVPGLNQLPGIRKDPGADPSTLSFTRAGLRIGRDHTAAYAGVCGFPAKDTVPLPYPHLLAFPLHLQAMTSPQFPYPAVGTVHLENAITSHRPLHPGEAVDVTVRVSSPRPHPNGRVVDFLSEVRCGGEVVWESTSTYLRRGRGEAGAPAGLDLDHTPVGTMEWRLPGDLGRRYAAVSGDHNPIHLHPLTAKALGFPRQIAHGMWSLARSVAALENRLPQAVTVEVAFKKPILLPGTVAFGHERVADGQVFSLTRPKDGAPHLVGRANPL